MEYKLLASNKEEELSRNVTEHLQNGWELYKRPMVNLAYGSQTTVTVIYSQAVIKHNF